MTRRVTPSSFKRLFVGDDDDYATQVPPADLVNVAGRYGPILQVTSDPDEDSVTITGKLRHTGGQYTDYQRTPEWYGAIGDGDSHPASVALGVTSLAELQVLFPFADSTGNEMDWLAWQAALYAGGMVKGRPEARYRIDKTLYLPNGRVQVDATHCDLLWEQMAEEPDDGTNLIDDALSGPVNTLLEPSVDWTFGGGLANWVDGAIGDPDAHFGQFGYQVFLPKGKWTVEATVTLSEGASSGYYGPPYIGFAFAEDQVGQGYPSYPDPLDKDVTLSPGDDGVPTTISFDFEVEEDAGRTMWLTFSGGNADIEIDLSTVRIKPFLMNYAIWSSGDPMEFANTDYDYDGSMWRGGQLIGPNSGYNDTFAGAAIGGILHKNFRGDGARCYFQDMILLKWLVGITLSDHAYLQRFDGMNIGYCGTCVKYLAGSVNAAENYRFYGCILFNSELAVHAAGGGEWFFFGTSWDYCRKFLVTDLGAYIATHGLHIEGRHAETYIPVSASTDVFDTADTLTGGNSGATAIVMDDKTDETPARVVVQLLSGTFVNGETITGALGGSATVGGSVVEGDVMFDIKGASMWDFVSGEILMAGSTHNGDEYLGRVESNMDQIHFGAVWLYNLKTASDTTWTGTGRVTVDRHMGPTNPNLARMWLLNHASDAYAGMGDFSTEGGTAGMTLTDALPADGVGLDCYLVGTGDRWGRLTYGATGPTATLDTGVARVTDGASLRLEVPTGYGSGSEFGLRVLVPVRNGKIVLDRYYMTKPDVMPDVARGPYLNGTPALNLISLSTTDGRSVVAISHDYVDGMWGAGVQPGWEVTISGVTGDPGGIPNATLNATHTITDVTAAGILIDPGVTATSTGSGLGGTAITVTYTQNNWLCFDRRLWVKVGYRDPDGVPTILQDQYQGESNYNVNFAAVDWMICPPDGNRWWYTERDIPADPLDRIGNGRAPEWATHMLMDLNLRNILYAVSGTDPPPVYLAGFFANVV